ncbi:hypothetical protein BLOT_012828 [Blomia tropicalis]|nr:hypothetical protein BLOT_012828 [Blomia tropicalis]
MQECLPTNQLDHLICFCSIDTNQVITSSQVIGMTKWEVQKMRRILEPVGSSTLDPLSPIFVCIDIINNIQHDIVTINTQQQLEFLSTFTNDSFLANQSTYFYCKSWTPSIVTHFWFISLGALLYKLINVNLDSLLFGHSKSMDVRMKIDGWPYEHRPMAV